MSLARNISISHKCYLAFGTVFALCIALGAYTFFTSRSISKMSGDVSRNAFPSVIYLGEVRAHVNEVRREDYDMLLCQTPACTATHGQRRQEALQGYESALKKYETTVASSGERDLYQKFVQDFARYLEVSNRGL